MTIDPQLHNGVFLHVISTTTLLLCYANQLCCLQQSFEQNKSCMMVLFDSKKQTCHCCEPLEASTQSIQTVGSAKCGDSRRQKLHLSADLLCESAV